jgi:hypothetical protein
MNQPLGFGMDCQHLAALMMNPWPEVREQLLKYVALVISIVVTATHNLLQSIYPKDLVGKNKFS